jgi:cytochrome c
MKRILILIAVLAFLTASKKEIKRPRDPWVFRSVLDTQPRMITALLSDEMFVAYDARYCGLYKAWKGEVILDGPVYTTKHGPQPTSEGYAYFEQRLLAPAWRFVIDGKETIPTAQFKGHFFKDDQVTFRFRLRDPQGNQVDLEETPEYIKKSGRNGLHRKFVIVKASNGVGVILKTSITNLQQEKDYETNGTVTADSTSTITYPDGSVFNVDITLVLNSDKETNLKIYYHPGFKAEATEAVAAKSILDQGKTLIDGSDCRTCHNEGVKTVGPAYLDVAKKYLFTPASIKILSEKVIKGGSGVWGQVVMNPHPDLMQEDAEKMVNYILSLDGESLEVENKQAELNLNVSTISIPFSDKNEFEKEEDGKNYPGLAASMYKIEDMGDDVYALPKKSNPVLTGAAPAVHITDGMEKYEGLSELVFIQFNGDLNIEQEGNYVLRVVSDDGAKLYVDNKEVVNNDGDHGAIGRDGEITLKKGKHTLRLDYYNNRGGYTISLQWAKHGDNKFSIIPNSVLSHNKKMFKKSAPYVPAAVLVKNIPGDRTPLVAVHPAFDLAQARPSSFEPRVGGMDFLSDSSLIICTWDSVGPVYKLEGVTRNNSEAIKVTRIASGLAEPLGIKVVNDTIYVLQKQELTRLIDTDKDGIIDDYQTVCDAWGVSANFHEFAFGLEYKDGYFYAALATAIEPGGASANPQIPDRGKVIKISKKDGSIEFIAHGLRTPNGIGIGVDGEIFIADNQGDWLPSSKIVHVKEGAWYGSRSVNFEGTANLKETPPVVWLPQDEIGNSPSQPTYLNLGPYKNQQIHGEVTHGGLKRVFVEKVNGEYQGAVFRFVQGLEGGVNRVVWGPDGSLYVGMIGNPGNWGQSGKKWFGVQRLTYNNTSVFEMLAVRAKSNGIEIEMTEPLGERYGNSPSDYEIKQWYYKPTINYGGPKLDQKNLEIKSVNISEDRKKVFLELKGMEANHVVYVRLKGVFVSSQDHELWSTEAWYTMNQIPANDTGFKNPAKVVALNSLTDTEVKQGWVSLFDGKSTAQWKRFNREGMSPAWKVKDNSIAFDKTLKKGEDHDIVTVNEYENFEFTLEWKIDKCGNSGIMFNVIDNGKFSYPWLTGAEMQVLDNVCHPDAAYPKHRAGDLYDMIETKYVTVNPSLEWNSIRIISNKGKVEFWQNGYQVVKFEMHNAEWLNRIKNSKFKDMPDFGLSKKGRIALQDHGDNVWYRNIRIRELK